MIKRRDRRVLMKPPMTKEKAIIEMILTWLDANMDEPPPEGIQEDSANLKEKIILALSDEATIEDIQNGNL
jgi:hypothetical protein